jgi:hypothetical protein
LIRQYILVVEGAIHGTKAVSNAFLRTFKYSIFGVAYCAIDCYGSSCEDGLLLSQLQIQGDEILGPSALGRVVQRTQRSLEPS